MEGAPKLAGEARNEPVSRALIKERKFAEIAATAIRIESRTNLLFSFEKMALRDAVSSPAGAKAFALELYDLLHGADAWSMRFATGSTPSVGCRGERPAC